MPLTTVAEVVITNDGGIRTTRTSQGKVNVKCPRNVFLSILRKKSSCCLVTSALHSQTSKIHPLASGIVLPLAFSSWNSHALIWDGIGQELVSDPEPRGNLLRATAMTMLWQRVCETESSVLGLGLKPPDSFHKLLCHMVAVLGTVGLKLNLWHEVKIKKKINPSVLHYRLPEASRLCSCLPLYSTERI